MMVKRKKGRSPSDFPRLFSLPKQADTSLVLGPLCNRFPDRMVWWDASPRPAALRSFDRQSKVGLRDGKAENESQSPDFPQ
jgi:hypothetical protein